MIKRIATPVFLLLLLIIIPPFFYLFNYSQTITLSEESKVVYEMPYPGLLPDHPLYFLKIARDRVLEFMTRNDLKKAELHLLLSDKRVKTAEMVAKEGKITTAVDTLSKGEKYFLKAVEDLKRAKEQGGSGTVEFMDKMQRSNKKHAEIIQQLMKDFPQGEQVNLNSVLELNRQNAKMFQPLLK